MTSHPPEWYECADDAAHFIDSYVFILNATNSGWERFRLWPAQHGVLGDLQAHRQVIVMKARQLGLTWLCLAYALWLMIFRPIATIGIFSLREKEAIELLALRLRRMYDFLPDWAQVGTPLHDSTTFLELPNGSTARAFPTTGGRSYTFSAILADEADHQDKLGELLTAVKPTVDAGGSMWLISSINKLLPMSSFKNLYRAAKRGETEWHPIFLPWTARPGRDAAWYEAIKRESVAETGSLDKLHQEYPATEAEALSPRSLDKRIPTTWLQAAFAEEWPIDDPDAPTLPNLVVFRRPVAGRQYILGADPAEGNPTSDESALCVVDLLTGEECAGLAGRFDPTVLAIYAARLAAYYNRAAIMPERNNHGHTFIAWFQANSLIVILSGPDEKLGWLSNSLGKVRLYDFATDTFRDAHRDQDVLLHSLATFEQLASVEGRTLLAPPGMADDRADAWALANAGRLQIQPAAFRQAQIAGRPTTGIVRTARRPQ